MSGLSSLFSFGGGGSSAAGGGQAAALVAPSAAVASVNPKARLFAEALSAALESFEAVREWPDLISALAKLSKVLAHPRFAAASAGGSIAEDELQLPPGLAISLAKRLAQCLNSGLPSGVHLKALEVLELVFARIGPSGLVANLGIWSMGLLPLFQTASSRVKPMVLDIVLRRYVPLGVRLMPALPGLLLAVLPGLEEDASESRDSVLAILERVRAATDARLYMRTVWSLLLTCPQIRLAAVNYLVVMLPKPTALSSSSSSLNIPSATTPAGATAPPALHLARFLTTPPSLSIAALLAALHSRDNVLTQRKVLELILSHFPLREPHLSAAPAPSPSAQQGSIACPSPASGVGSVLSTEEQVELVSGALDVLLLQDISLSRRLFTWLLANVTDTTAGALPPHSLTLLQSTLERMLQSVLPQLSLTTPDVVHLVVTLPTSASPSSTMLLAQLLRPFQLLSILLDRDEIAQSALLPSLHPALLRYIYEVHGAIREQDRLLRSHGGDAATAADRGGAKRASKHVHQYRHAASAIVGPPSAMDHVHAFYALLPVAPVWAALQQQLQQAQSRLADLLTQLREDAAEASHAEALVAACDAVDLQMRLLDFACDFLPITSPAATPASTSAAPAVVVPSTLAATVDVSSALTCALDAAAGLLEARSLDHAMFALRTALRKLVPLCTIVHEAELSEGRNVISSDLIGRLLMMLPTLMAQLRESAMEQGADHADASLECTDLLLQLCSALLSVPSTCPTLLGTGISSSGGASFIISPTPPPSVPPSPASTPAGFGINVGTPVRGRSRAGSFSRVSASPPVPQRVDESTDGPAEATIGFTTLAPAHAQLLRTYHDELLRFLRMHCDAAQTTSPADLEHALLGLSHWMSLVEAYGAAVLSRDELSNDDAPVFSDTCSFVLQRLWHFLRPECAHAHPQVAQLVYRLLRVESSFVGAERGSSACVEEVAQLVLNPRGAVSAASATLAADLLIDGFARLAELWRLLVELDASIPPLTSPRMDLAATLRPWLWILLDALAPAPARLNASEAAASVHVRLLARDWLRGALARSLEQLLDPLLGVLLHVHTSRRAGVAGGPPIYASIFDMRTVAHALHQLQVVMDADAQFLEQAMRRKPSAAALRLLDLHAPNPASSSVSSAPTASAIGHPLFLMDSPAWIRPRSYLQLLCVTLLKFVQSRFPPSSAPDVLALSAQNGRLRAQAAELLQAFVEHIPAASAAAQIAQMLAPQVLLTLAQCTGAQIPPAPLGRGFNLATTALPAAAEPSPLANVDPLMQLQLLPLLRVLLSECGRRSDFTEGTHGQHAQQTSLPLLTHYLFSQTVLLGLKGASPAATVPIARPAPVPSPHTSSDALPSAKQTIASLSLLPSPVQSFFPPLSSSDSSAFASAAPPAVVTLGAWLSFVVSTLPLVRATSPSFVAAIVGHLCFELQTITKQLKTSRVDNTPPPAAVAAHRYSSGEPRSTLRVGQRSASAVSLRPGLVASCQTLLDGVRSILYFCLATRDQSNAPNGHQAMHGGSLEESPSPSPEGVVVDKGSGGSNSESMASSMLTSLSSVFSAGTSKPTPKPHIKPGGQEAHMRESLYEQLPTILESLLGLWDLSTSLALQASAREIVEGLLARASTKTLQALATVWQRSLSGLARGEVEPPCESELPETEGLAALFGAQHLSATHRRTLRLLHALAASVGSPDLLVARLVPLALAALARAAPHGRRNKSKPAPVGGVSSGLGSPQSSPTAMTTEAAGSSGASQAAAASQRITLIAPLEATEFAYLHMLYCLLKYTPHTRVLAHMWHNKEANTSGEASATNKHGNLSQLFASSVVQACDHPLALPWMLSIMQTWLHRSGVCSGTKSPAKTSNASNLASASPAVKEAPTTPSSSFSEFVLDKKTLRDIQSALSLLLTTCASQVGENVEMVVEAVSDPTKTPTGVFGVPLALLPPAIYFIAPRDELNDLLPPLPPWLEAVASRTHQASKALHHPSWPHLQVTVPRGQAEWNVLLHSSVPVATGSLLNYTPPAVTASTANDAKRTAKGWRVSMSLALVSLRCLSNITATLLLEAFANVSTSDGTSSVAAATAVRIESEHRGVSLLQSLLPLLLPALQQHHPLNLPLVAPVVAMLASLSAPQLAFAFKAWRAPVWDSFFSSVDSVLPNAGGSAVQQPPSAAASHNFFMSDVSTLEQYRWAISRCVAEDKNLLASFFALDRSALNLESFASQLGGAASGLFASKESELASRRSSLRKLSFILHAGRKDQYARHLPAILERLIEHLKILPPSPQAGAAGVAVDALARSVHALHASVFLCLRVLLTRVSSEHLAAVWPIVLMELIRIFAQSRAAVVAAMATPAQPQPLADASLLAHACKFVDVAMVMLPAQFNLYSWMFVSKQAVEDLLSSTNVRPSPAASPNPTPTNLSLFANVFPSATAASTVGAGNTTILPPHVHFEPHAQHLEGIDPATGFAKFRVPISPSASPTSSSILTTTQLLRPVLLRRHVHSQAELAAFHSRLSSALRDAGTRPPLEPDLAFVDALLLSDLCEFPELQAVPPPRVSSGAAVNGVRHPTSHAAAATSTPSPLPASTTTSGLSVSLSPSSAPGTPSQHTTSSSSARAVGAPSSGPSPSRLVKRTSTPGSNTARNPTPTAKVPPPIYSAPAAALAMGVSPISRVDQGLARPALPLPFAQLTTLVRARPIVLPPPLAKANK